MIKNVTKITTFLIIIFLLFCSETPKNYYKTLADAKENGAIERGWLPALIVIFKIKTYKIINIKFP